MINELLLLQTSIPDSKMQGRYPSMLTACTKKRTTTTVSLVSYNVYLI